MGDQLGAELGTAVGAAGDVNGDTIDDFIVGAQAYDAPGETDGGGAFIWYGSGTGPIGGLGPYGSAWWTAGSSYCWLGHDVATAGDVNGDGIGDVIVGAHGCGQATSTQGRAYVYYGPLSGPDSHPDWIAAGDQPGPTWFGHSAGTAGDVNNDGYDDVIIGAPGYTIGAESEEGAVFVWYGSSSGLPADPPAATPTPTNTSTATPTATSTATPTTTLTPTVTGSPTPTPTAAVTLTPSLTPTAAVTPTPTVTVTPFPPGGVPSWYTPDATAGNASWAAQGAQAAALLGVSTGTAGDVNGDGYADVIAGATQYDGEGALFVWLGSDGGLGQTACLRMLHGRRAAMGWAASLVFRWRQQAT